MTRIISISIVDYLKKFSPEIEYSLNQMGRYLNLEFQMTNDLKTDISYGHSGGKIEIKDFFFTQCCDVNENGIFLRPKVVLPVAVNCKYFEIDFFALFQDLSAHEIVTKNNEKIQINFDLIGSIFFQLSRIEELNCGDLDKYDRFKMENTLAYKSGFIDRPEVNLQLELLKKLLGHVNRHPLNIHLTHDVDRLKSYHSLGRLFYETGADIIKGRKGFTHGIRYLWNNLNSHEPKRSFHYLMGLSEKYHQKSTFFFIPDGKIQQDADYQDRYRNELLSMVEQVKKRGHHIGIHSGFNTFNDREEFRLQLKKLESIISMPLKLCRQHVLRWRPQTMDLQESLGITCDYTLAFPAGITFRSGATFGHNGYSLEKRKQLRLMLYPTTIMEFAIFMKKYVDIPSEKAFELIRKQVEWYKRFGGDLVVLFHTVVVFDYQDEYEKTLKIIFDAESADDG